MALSWLITQHPALRNKRINGSKHQGNNVGYGVSGKKISAGGISVWRYSMAKRLLAANVSVVISMKKSADGQKASCEGC